MMISDPVPLPARAGSICAWVSVNFGTTTECEDFRLTAPGRLPFELLCLAIQRHLPVRVLEECRRLHDASLAHDGPAARDHIHRAERIRLDGNHVGIAPGRQPSL